MRPLAYALSGALVLFAAIVAIMLRSGRPGPGEDAEDADGKGWRTGLTDGGRGGSGAGPSALPPESQKPGARGTGAPGEVRPDGSGGEEPLSDDTASRILPIAPGTAEIVFVVEDASLKPVRGVDVTLRSGRQAATERTAGDGTALFSGIQDGTYTYRVEAQGIPDLVSARDVTLSPDERKEIRLRLGVFNLTIAGRIRDREGQPLPGVRVYAREQLQDVGEDKLVPASQELFRGESGADGAYEIARLDAMDYVVSTEPTDLYPSVRKVFRAGTQTADLIMEASRELLIRGVVKGAPDGRPLPDAVVVPLGQYARQAKTDKAGKYSIALEVESEREILVFTATREGFREARLNVLLEEVGASAEWEANFVLEPLGILAPVTGIVVDSSQKPVPGETVYMQSPSLNARYQASSDASGRFSMGQVQVGDDYRVMAYPKARRGNSWFRDYSRSPVAVTDDGLELEIVLETLGSGSLSGVMVDTSGASVSRFTLWVRSMKGLGNSIPLTSDESGAFQVESVPEGDLIFETRSLPRLSIRGVQARPGENVEVRLPLDWGDHSFGGTVVDEKSSPVGGAKVSLTWGGSEKQVQSSSYRSTVTDGAGRFVFSELGKGEHRISVNASGFLQVQATHDVGSGAPEPAIRIQAEFRGRRNPER